MSEAKSTAFMLGEAKVMVGAQNDLFGLNETEHSIGLVKNFRISSEPSYVDLTQGVRNSIVYSVMTSNVVRASMEVYEYTAANMAYALGLEGGNFTAQTVTTTTSAPAAANDTSVTVADETGFSAGDWVIIKDGATGAVQTRKLTNVAVGSLTFAEPLPAAIPAGASVAKSNVLEIGAKQEQPFLSAKVAGRLADGTSVIILCPKVRITKGFSVGFVSNDYDNMPFEFTFYDLLTNDPFYADFNGSQAKLLTTA